MAEGNGELAEEEDCDDAFKMTSEESQVVENQQSLPHLHEDRLR
jgi:hypothetical protein